MNKASRGLFSELASRGVYQAVGIYVAVAWGAIEILITVADRFGWPVWVGDAALILFLTALPFVVLLSWSFDLTGHGLRRVEPGSLKGKVMIAGGVTIVLAVAATFLVLRNGADDQKAPTRSATFAQVPDQPVIAVLPFEEFIGTEQGELLARSFTDEVINRINSHPDLIALDWNTVSNPLVTGFISSAQADGGVDYVVKGSLRSAAVGKELRVRMLDLAGTVIWEHDEVRTLDDPEEARVAQKYVAAQVASGVGTTLTGLDYCELSASEEALAMYYEARDLFALRGKNVATAAMRLEKAIELDPNFARAMGLLADVYRRFAAHVFDQPQHYRGMSQEQLISWWEEERPVATAARAALDRCPSLGGAYVAMEISAPVPHSLADEAEFTHEGLRREPGNINLLDRLIYLHFLHGQLKQAREYASEFHRRLPLSPRANRLLSMTERLLGNHERALELQRTAVKYGYDEYAAYHNIAFLLLTLGDREALVEHLGPGFLVSQEHEPGTLFYDPVAFLDSKNDPELRQRLTAELSEMIDQLPPDHVRSALLGFGFNPVLLEFGDRELAWKALEKSLQSPGLAPASLWAPRYRHWFGPRLLTFQPLREDFTVFWDQFGPPDGCDWDGTTLRCPWAEEPADLL